jgi:two-component system KDP operon response regulator KdpE
MERQGPRILLVDDEESIQHTLSTVLPPAGYTVYQVRNGKEALRKVQSIRPDLILLDLGLPDIDGKDVIPGLREQAIAPIIVISVRDDETEKVAASRYRSHDYLTKPFTLPELLARMRATLRSVSATQDDVFMAGNPGEPAARAHGFWIDYPRIHQSIEQCFQVFFGRPAG